MLKYKLQGELNANIQFSSLYRDPLINAGLNIEDFQVGKFPVGDIVGRSTWNHVEKYFDLSLSSILDGQQVVDIKGIYTPKVEEQLNLVAHFKGANLNLVEPFVDKTFTDLEGKLTGDIEHWWTLATAPS